MRMSTLAHWLGGEVEAVDVAAVLEHDGILAQRRELHVEVGETGQLSCLFRPRVVDEEIHPLVGVAVGEEVDPVASPHRDDVLRRIVRDILGRLGVEVVDPDVVGHAAAIALPRAELAEDAVVGELLAVRREGAEAAARQGQFLGQIAGQCDGVQPAHEVVERVHPRAKDDVLAVRRPGHHDVVRPHAVGDIVPAERGGIGEPLRHAAVGRHHVDFRVAVVLAGEGDGLAVGREPGEHLEAFAVRELARRAAVGTDGVEVAGVGEDDLVLINRGKRSSGLPCRQRRRLCSGRRRCTERTGISFRFLTNANTHHVRASGRLGAGKADAWYQVAQPASTIQFKRLTVPVHPRARSEFRVYADQNGPSQIGFVCAYSLFRSRPRNSFIVRHLPLKSLSPKLGLFRTIGPGTADLRIGTVANSVCLYNQPMQASGAGQAGDPLRLHPNSQSAIEHRLGARREIGFVLSGLSPADALQVLVGTALVLEMALAEIGFVWRRSPVRSDAATRPVAWATPMSTTAVPAVIVPCLSASASNSVRPPNWLCFFTASPVSHSPQLLIHTALVLPSARPEIGFVWRGMVE